MSIKYCKHCGKLIDTDADNAKYLEERKYYLHIEAGLIPQGKDDDGRQEWLGTNKQWRDYEKKLTKLIKYKYE